MKEKEITVLMVEPGKHPVVTTLENSLDALQKAVSIATDYQGLIELVELERGVCLLCNEEGKLIGLEGNRRIGADIIAGVFYILGENGKGELCSLPKEMLDKYMARFWSVECYTPADVERALFAPLKRLSSNVIFFVGDLPATPTDGRMLCLQISRPVGTAFKKSLEHQQI